MKCSYEEILENGNNEPRSRFKQLKEVVSCYSSPHPVGALASKLADIIANTNIEDDKRLLETVRDIIELSQGGPDTTEKMLDAAIDSECYQ